METTRTSRLSEVLSGRGEEILNDWVALQNAATTRRGDLINDADLRRHSQDFLAAFQQALATDVGDIGAPAWDAARVLLGDITRGRARLGFTPSETATFVFSLKQALFRALEKDPGNGGSLVESLWAITEILDRLGLLSTEVYQKSRE